MPTTAFFEKSEVLVWQPKKSARNWKKRLCLEDQKKTRKKIVKMTNSFVNMKSWKKSRYMLPKTVFVAATFCMLYMAYNPSASSSSKGLSSKQGPLSMSQAELDSLYKGHRSVFVNFCPVLVEFKDREAFRTLVESLVQMTPSFHKFSWNWLSYSLKCLFQQNSLVNTLIWQFFWKCMI